MIKLLCRKLHVLENDPNIVLFLRFWSYINFFCRAKFESTAISQILIETSTQMYTPFLIGNLHQSS